MTQGNEHWMRDRFDRVGDPMDYTTTTSTVVQEEYRVLVPPRPSYRLAKRAIVNN